MEVWHHAIVHPITPTIFALHNKMNSEQRNLISAPIWRMVLKVSALLLTVAAIVLVIFLVSGILAKSKTTLVLEPSARLVIMGHSHPECAFVDSMSPSLVNLAQSGESYFYTYQKLKALLPNNGQITDIYVEFTNNQIDQEMDDWIWSDKYMSHRFPMYAPFLSFQDACLLAVKNPKCFLLSFTLSIKENVLKCVSSGSRDLARFGGYNGLQSSIEFNGGVRFNAVELNSGLEEESDISFKNIFYLEKMVTLCSTFNVQLHLMRSPQHAGYKKTNEETYQQIRKERFATVSYLDFGDMQLADSLFADTEHLNINGGQYFTRYFLETVYPDGKKTGS